MQHSKVRICLVHNTLIQPAIVMKITGTIFISIVLFLSSCAKKDGVVNDGLIGKWQLTEVYDGYFNGGGFKWNPIPSEDSHTLQFEVNGEFTQEYFNRGSNQICFGSYTIFPGMKVQINDNCNTVSYIKNVTELSPSTLIIDMQGIEGTIRFKYQAVQ